METGTERATVPDHFLSPRWRRFAWPFTIGFLMALAVLTATLTFLVRDARRDVGQLTESARTAEVATCYATARGRPALIVILKLISGLAVESSDRRIVNAQIAEYEARTPTVPECDTLARDRGLDPKDFPPQRPSGSRQ